MLKHHETIAGRLESIDTNLAALTEAVQGLAKNLLAIVENPTTAGPQDDMLEPLLDKTQVMEYLDIRETAYYRWVKEGKLRPRGGKGHHKYYPGDIKKLMEQRKYRKRG